MVLFSWLSRSSNSARDAVVWLRFWVRNFNTLIQNNYSLVIVMRRVEAEFRKTKTISRRKSQGACLRWHDRKESESPWKREAWLICSRYGLINGRGFLRFMGRLASCHTTSSNAGSAFPDFVNDSALGSFVRVRSSESNRQAYCASPQSIFEKSKTTADENQVGNLSSHKNPAQLLHSCRCKAPQTSGQGRNLYRQPPCSTEKSLSEIWNPPSS